MHYPYCCTNQKESEKIKEEEFEEIVLNGS
jgi:hypothetical protein